MIALRIPEYWPCCPPDFAESYFPGGITDKTLRLAPYLRFERRDGLQARWAREVHGIDLEAPVHWVPSTFGFLNLTLAGMAWGMHPASITRPRIASEQLVELCPHTSIAVQLYWTVSRLHAKPLTILTDAVRRAARRNLLASAQAT